MKPQLTKPRLFASLYRALGARWMLFRLTYAFRLRAGLLRLQMPSGAWEDYKAHIKAVPAAPQKEPRFLFSAETLPIPQQVPWDKQKALEEANRLLSGEIKYFAHQFFQTGFPPSWHKAPLPAFELAPAKHWSEYSDDPGADIKYIWEPNRFSFVYSLVRAYAVSQDETYPAAFWTLLEDWAKHNPPNSGPNWMDGQEISLRLIAWTFGYFAFLRSPSSTPQRLERFRLYVAAQAERVYRNRAFAVFAYNNHSITEAFALWMIGLLFPTLKNADKYFAFGRQSLEREVRAQIFPDGTYSMYSLNYHRFVLQIYLYALQLAKRNNISFSDELHGRIRTSLEYLSALIIPQTGEMPLYGSNDGALLLPLNNCDFTDYRPLLQLGWYITKGEVLFQPGPWDEDVFWICGESALAPAPAGREGQRLSPLSRGRTREEAGLSFPYGGNYLLRNTNSHVLIRCTDFRARPSHADQLHVDLWMGDRNIAIDAGTYLYSGEGIWRNGLARTAVHNTVTVDGKDQMTLLSRFTWANWSKGKVCKHEKNVWQGEHDGYQPVSHKRTVMALEGDRWLVIDELNATEPHYYALHWLLADFPFEPQEHSILLSVGEMKYKIHLGVTTGSGRFSLVRADPHSTRGWRSRYYGHKEPALSVMLEAVRPQVVFWSFFGFEQDVVEVRDAVLKVNSIPLWGAALTEP